MVSYGKTRFACNILFFLWCKFNIYYNDIIFENKCNTFDFNYCTLTVRFIWLYRQIRLPVFYKK